MVRSLLGERAHHAQDLAHQLGVERRLWARRTAAHRAPWPAPARWRRAAAGRPKDGWDNGCACRDADLVQQRLGALLGARRDRPSTWIGASVRFCSTVRWDHRLKLWNTMPTRARMRSAWRLSMWPRGRPSGVHRRYGYRPLEGFQRLMQRRKVLLPDPLAPMIETTSPASAVIEIPLSTSSAAETLVQVAHRNRRGRIHPCRSVRRNYVRYAVIRSLCGHVSKAVSESTRLSPRRGAKAHPRSRRDAGVIFRSLARASGPVGQREFDLAAVSRRIGKSCALASPAYGATTAHPC
jgi:hypothetical protein